VTPQEIFDKVATHLLAQGKKARNGAGGPCLYRAEDGARCAAGCLIPDELYNASMECKRIRVLSQTYKLPEFITDNIRLIVQLQDVHDQADPTGWRSELHRVAADNNLSAAVLS